MGGNAHDIPSDLVDILISLNLEDPKYPKNLQVITNYLNEDLIKNTNKLVNYIIDNINVGQINNSISNYLADIIIYIQKANTIENSEELKKNEETINSSLIWDETCSTHAEYRIKINDEKLKKYIVNDYRNDIINNCTKHINYLKLLYVVSNNILPQNGYMLFINIIHNIDINYQYKLLSLEYFAHVANKITLERAKYIAQILPIVLDKFYNIDGEPYYNDNINNIDTLISMCKFINILCDKSIKSQEDDKQDVALHSIVAFIMRIICYHNFYLPLNKNVEKLFPYIKYDSIDYNECINVYKTIPLVSYRNKSDHIIRACLSSLIWRLSIINPNLYRILERVNILIPNTKSCVLENTTLEISLLSYLILVERINTNAFPLVFSQLYLFNLMIRNTYNIILCLNKAKKYAQNNLYIKACHFISISTIFSRNIKIYNNEYYGNIYNFKWRPFDFLKKMYEIFHTYNDQHNYTKIIYNCVSNIMRNFSWNVFFSLYNKLIIESTSDRIKSTIASYLKDQLYKQMLLTITDEGLSESMSDKREDLFTSNNKTSELEYKTNKINKLGTQIKNVIFTLISEDSVLLYADSITVVLNIVKMVLLNKSFRPFCKHILNFDENSTCFLQNKIKYFYDQIKIERSVFLKEQNDTLIKANTNPKRDSAYDINLNKLDVIVMLLNDIETSIESIKNNS
ncbi:conserved Plasmodium protein, unknown function [Plasmodium berghei]|uniref:Uncharacterized protein n=2 Tax=Plasmodium berghei TaxID=5821 RepID=A0A509AQ77_PLABA|nr:conserved Plasmodium protein, unknown function [Plasmodium berghei ANKA]CXJ13469.1 conserved Plasmodium protein, unknown function [Plasmodium berghei]SCM26135.1 conserved Plasmodium protein, unknown function [Plasmodium berghei]SCN28296.1 conserved Plasmodium protein, unknown function [Plasmodium berghei]SCO62494.1 conserved Plasmodium protein, unknown function [Plasmodium berghei]SCO64052.1 conserved Plasmodium protein, unknown function [Plasmodium berghei]|eukprot:XP_034423948.1 conserved Plasmodium protein, unknown function [Plasmodium berghei ANKA]